MHPFWHLQMRNNKAECSSNDRTKTPNTAVQRFGIEIKRKNIREVVCLEKYVKKQTRNKASPSLDVL